MSGGDLPRWATDDFVVVGTRSAMSGKTAFAESLLGGSEDDRAAYEAGRQWGKFNPWSAPLRVRGWKWRR